MEAALLVINKRRFLERHTYHQFGTQTIYTTSTPCQREHFSVKPKYVSIIACLGFSLPKRNCWPLKSVAAFLFFFFIRRGLEFLIISNPGGPIGTQLD